MAGTTDNLWDSQKPSLASDDAAAQNLSRLVAGTQHLVSEPGLTLALFQGNASPQQAQAIDQFLGGLRAEQAVRTAAVAGTKIQLDGDQKSALNAMGIDYSHVEYTQQNALADLTTKMAAQGYRPVLDASGNVQTDAKGDVVSEQIPQKKKHSDGWFDSVGGFFHHLGNNPVTHFVSNATQGRWSGNDDINSIMSEHAGVGGAATVLNEGYQYISSQLSQSYETAKDPLAGAHADEQNQELAKRLGYDPGSFFSMQAFRAKGYAHTDTSAAQDSWDEAHPDGLYGWDGQQAVIEAEAFGANPEHYRNEIVNDTSLTPDEVAAKLQAISSADFQHLVARVNGNRSDIGTDLARGIGIDPVKHPTAFTLTSAATDLAASFVIDPLAFGLKAATAAKVNSVAVRGFADASGIERVLRPVGGPTTMAQANVIANVKNLVSDATALREAQAAGDTVQAARITARVHASNPFAPLLPDFMGEDQIIAHVTENEAMTLGKGELPFITGRGEAIDTFDKAVEYLASKSALLRLQGGLSGQEASVMPGALSSWGYLKLKGGVSAWSAGRGAVRSETAAARLVASAKADPGRLETLIKDGLLTRVLPSDSDAVDVLSGKVLAAQKQVAMSETLAERWGAEAAKTADSETHDVAAAAKAKLASDQAGLASARRAYLAAKVTPIADEDLAITDTGRGILRGNQLRYGLSEAPTSKIGKLTSIYTLGTVQRAKLAISRFTNWLPRDTHIDLTSASSADTIRKIARTYLTSGDANMMSARWINGDLATRKTIVQGLREQMIHAAGLTRTKAGQDLITKWRAGDESYATFGREFTDANGRNAAQWPGQVQTKFALPNFGEVHKAAAKIGLYEGTMGRFLNSTPMDKLLTQWKLGALATPVTAMRANLESWLNAYAEGMFGSGVRAKALLRTTGKLDGEDIARSRGIDRVLSLAPLQAMGRFYQHVVGSTAPEAEAEAVLNMPDDIMHAWIHDQAAYHYAMSVDPAGVGEATEIARNGFHAVKAGYDTPEAFHSALKVRKGYEVTDETNGVAGANLYAHNLAMRVNKAPNVAKAVLDRIENPALYDSDHVVQAVESGPAKRLMDQSLFGKVFIRPDGTQARAITDAEVELGKRQWADQITEEFKQLVTGRNAKLQGDIAAYVRTHGRAPDADWILKNVKGLNRPNALLKPTFDAVPAKGGVEGFVADLQQAEGKGYQWLVERLIQRHTTTPLFAAAYGKSKVLLDPLKAKLIDGGLSEEAAERATANVAAGQAWDRIAKMIDDPRLKSQMDIAGRSFFAFSRATTMMLRRWGGTFWRNPVQARRFQLAGEAAVHSGLVYKNQNGDWTFHFPASGVAQEVLFHAMSHIPGMESLAQFPTSDFTGRVTSIIPGSSNPFQYNTTPMVSIAGRELFKHIPDHRELFDEIDAKLNGSQGQGQGVLATLEPSLVKKVVDPTDDDRNSITTSAMVGSLYNLYAAGQVPPDGASPSQIEEFFGRLRTQTKTQLYLRGLFGAFSPASINLPENGNDASKSDYAYAASGIQNLHDEYKQLLNETGGDLARATAIWTALHPDLAVYEQSGSSAVSKGASMPSTQAAYNWLVKNASFISKYKSVSAFFIPQSAANAPFSMQAYRAQLEEGLRQKKTPQEFLTGVRVASAATVYYAMETQYESDLADAKASSDTEVASARRADWAAWSKQFKAQHPSFAAKTEASASNIVTAQAQIADLRSMVKSRQVPGGLGPAVAGMVKAYDDYKVFVDGNPGSTNQATANRSSALSQLQGYLSQVVQVAPGLTDLYNAVFRPLVGYNIEQITPTGG